MYGLGRFNLARFNLIPEPATEIYIMAHMALMMRAQITRGEDYYTQAQMPSLLECAAVAAPAWRTRAKTSITAQAEARGYVDVPRATRQQLVASGGLWLSLNRHAATRGENTLRTDIYVSANVLRSAEMAEALFPHAFLSRDTYALGLRHRMHMDGEVSPTRFVIHNARFDLEIPPGATLVIDSGGYVVLLDGESVIHTHAGDWLHLTRATHDVVFEADAGALSVDKRILYTERWL